MPSRLKLGVRADLSEVGDFSECTPLLEATSWGEGISMVKSRFGRGNCLTTLALVAPVMVPTESGESPLDDGDMLSSEPARSMLLCARVCVCVCVAQGNWY